MDDEDHNVDQAEEEHHTRPDPGRYLQCRRGDQSNTRM